MHINFKNLDCRKTPEASKEKYRYSMLTKSNKGLLFEVRSSLNTPLAYTSSSTANLRQKPASSIKLPQTLKQFKDKLKNAKDSSSLVTSINTLTSKISNAKYLLRPNPSQLTLLPPPTSNQLNRNHQQSSIFGKRSNTSQSTMNLQSQHRLKPRGQVGRDKMCWAANLKQYYIGHIVRGVMGINQKASQHMYETHLFMTSSIIPPKTFVPLNLPCHPQDKPKKVLVIDLDQTLVHYQSQSHECGQIQIQLEQGQKGYVSIRPYALSFLKKMSKYYEIMVFTASEKSYADTVLDQFDLQGLIKHRLYREHCLKLDHNLYTKDLRVINRDLSQMVLVDNSAASFLCQPENGIPILPYEGGEDRQLLQLQKYLQNILGEDDVRHINRQTFKLQRYRQFGDCEQLVNVLYREGKLDYY